MAETLVEDLIIQENTVENSPKAQLAKFLRENNVKTFTEKDFDFPKDEKVQEEIHAEIDEFMQMRENWREADQFLSKERKEL